MDKVVNFTEYLKDYPAGGAIELRDGTILYRGKIYVSKDDLPGGKITFLPQAMSVEEYEQWLLREGLRDWKKWLKRPLLQLKSLWSLLTRRASR